MRLERRIFAMHGFHPSGLYALQFKLYHLPDTQLALSFEPGTDLSPLFQPHPEPVYPSKLWNQYAPSSPSIEGGWAS